MDRAGFATIDITPSFEVELIGGWWPLDGGRTDKVFSRLHAQALVMEGEGGIFCLISIDTLGLTQWISANIRALVAGRLGTDTENVMLNFTHTHEAPAPLSPVNGARYLQLLTDNIVACAENARKNMRPATASWALTHAPYGENRRDGGTALDDRLAFLRISDAESGAPIGAVARLTGHANILMRGIDGKSFMSADYIGMAREGIAARLGCPAMIIQGAAGNVKPAGVHKSEGGTPCDVERVSKIIVSALDRLEFGRETALKPAMDCQNMEFISDVPGETEAAQIAADGLRLCGADGSAWLDECAKLRREGISEQVAHCELQCLRVAGGIFCGVPYEIFCELALEAEARTGNPLFFLNGYTNGCEGYLPDASEWDKGGFETLYSYFSFFQFYNHVMPFRRDTAEAIVSAALALYRR